MRIWEFWGALQSLKSIWLLEQEPASFVLLQFKTGLCFKLCKTVALKAKA